MADEANNTKKTKTLETAENPNATASPKVEKTPEPKTTVSESKGEKVANKMLKSKEVETDKYDSVRVVSRFAKLIGWAFFIIYAIVGISALINNWFLTGVYFLFSSAGTGLIYLVIGFIFGDILQILIDIEKNTQKKSD